MKKSKQEKRSFNFKELCFTGLYSGYSPVAPGTAGTIVGMGIYFIEYLLFKEACWIVNLVVVVIMIYPSIKLADKGELYFGIKDPPQVVLDECMGYWISMLFFPCSIRVALIAFFLLEFLILLNHFLLKGFKILRAVWGL